MVARACRFFADRVVGRESVPAVAGNTRRGVGGLTELAVIYVAGAVGHAIAAAIEVEVGSTGRACACALVAIKAISGDVGRADSAGNASAIAQQVVETDAAQTDAVSVAGCAVCIQAGHAGAAQQVFASSALEQAYCGCAAEEEAWVATSTSGAAVAGEAVGNPAVQEAALAVGREQVPTKAGLTGAFGGAELAVADRAEGHTLST